jgi:glycosyltransferase involved in cell wall biosynthesis
MNTDRLVSIIIPNFNRGDLLKETLESVSRQSYPNWEAIVVDDGSLDNSDRIGLEYTQVDARIQYFKRTQTLGGAPVCRNIGIQKSKGDFLLFLDSDDLLAPFCLEQRLKTIEAEPELDFWVFPMLMFFGTPQNANKLWNIANSEPDLHRFLKLDAVWQTSGPIWSRKAIDKLVGFTEGLACWQDVDFHLKAFELGLNYSKFYHLKPDIFYRQHETGSISQNEISSPAKINSRRTIFISHAENLVHKSDKDVLEGLRVLGTNVVIGAVKSLHAAIAHEVVMYGFKNKIFSLRFVVKTYFLLGLMVLRLNKLAFVAGFIDRLIKKRRITSNIGRHYYTQT